MSPLRTSLVALLVVGVSGCISPEDLTLDAFFGPSLPEALVLDSHYDELVVEVDYAAGVRPCTTALSALVSTLEETTEKRTVTLVGPTPIKAQGGDYTNGRLADIHGATSDHGPGSKYAYGSGDTAHLHVIYLDGTVKSEGDGHTAGRTAYHYGAIFIFKETFEGVYKVDTRGKRDATCDMERTVLLHELGHALGIVNRGVPMTEDREDADHPGHSENPRSVMFAKLRVSQNKLVLTDLPTGFDAHDLADLRAYRDG